MLSKNEIKLQEVKDKRVIRRLAFSDTGFVPTIHDYHFDGIQVVEGRLDVTSVTPTQRLAEDDYVIEHIVEPDGATQRYELYRYTAGRLRSCSVAANLDVMIRIVSKNREIGRWLTTDTITFLGPNFLNKVFPNRSWYSPDLTRVALGTLRQLIPSRELWEGKCGIDLPSLILSFHKLVRLYSKKAVETNKRNAKKHKGQFNYDCTTSKAIYFELPRGPGQATLLTTERPAKEGTIVAAIETIGKINIKGGEDHGLNLHDRPIYDISLYLIETDQGTEDVTEKSAE